MAVFYNIPVTNIARPLSIFYMNILICLCLSKVRCRKMLPLGALPKHCQTSTNRECLRVPLGAFGCLGYQLVYEVV